jgi:hypothetical protein
VRLPPGSSTPAMTFPMRRGFYLSLLIAPDHGSSLASFDAHRGGLLRSRMSKASTRTTAARRAAGAHR